ncbi:MAG TPA: acetyl-CoA carboxylase carboxyl transferase subunit alpha [Candidatus Competibacteraceae bacterium]|nr:acetyl-CoA carboxylase carboxyl transferase subunit alpha [Candidatus Competibacteraceae bacterium]
MNPNSCLDFEKPIAELEAMLKELRHLSSEQDLNISDEIARLEAKSKALTDSIFATLTPWQIAQIARHPLRPYTLDYIDRLFSEFQELHGDRAFADDHALVGGLARFEGRPVMVIGHQKGRDTREKIYRNFGMPRPEGYRKALRLMKLAERFHLPVLTFIDTPGAYPGIGAEERGQSEAIARNLFEMSRLRVPVICTVIGEGGSGGALAIGVGDRILMLQYSTYSVISPEGCAAILWKSADKAPDAAEAMGLTADKLHKLNLIDTIVAEPPGGAHRDMARMAEYLRAALLEQLRQLDALTVDERLEQRYQRLMGYGVFREAEPLMPSLQSTWQSSVAALLRKDKGEG